MNKQQSNQMASLRKKLFAAIAMLLVACIMTVSSTYAWFTLSTAPEVKGISTTVGANGNLEMALGYVEFDENGVMIKNTFFGTRPEDDPSSAPGSSMFLDGNSALEANKTWGNLVDLTNGYGLNMIKLYPTRLNMAADGIINRDNPLKFPKYGADGRITTLEAAMLGKYADGAFATVPGDRNTVGVNAVGNVSSFTPRQQAVREYKAAVESNRKAANSKANAAIAQAGALAGLLISEPADNDPIDESSVADLNKMIGYLDEARSLISDAIEASVLAYLGGLQEDGVSAINDTVWAIIVSKAEELDVAEFLDWLKAPLAEAENFDVPDLSIDSLQDYVDYYLDPIKSKIDDAKDAMTDATADGSATWAEIQGAVQSLVDGDDMTLNGYTPDQIMGGDDEVLGALMANMSNLKLTFVKNSANGENSIFNDIAVMIGAYGSSLVFPEDLTVEYGGFSIPLGQVTKNDPMAVEVEADLDKGTLDELSNVTKEFPDAPGADTSKAQALSDVYGYTIDLLFRTNAVNSYLQLQTSATGRVYGENGTDETMGSGSNMLFTVTAANDEAAIKKMAEAIRVVFYDLNGKILGVAVLDTDVSADESNTALQMDLKLANYTISEQGKITIDADQRFAQNDTATEQDDSKALCALNPNEKTPITALVYLDGDKATNAEAVMEDLQAVLNLQFSSSADLQPMDYSDLQGNGTSSDDTTTSTTAPGGSDATGSSTEASTAPSTEPTDPAGGEG